METVRGQFKKVREQRELSVENVADMLRISKDYIIAIEEKDYHALPEKVYAIGFIRSYARFLGIDAESTVSEYKTECVIEKQPVLIKENARLSSIRNDISDILRRTKLEAIQTPHSVLILVLLIVFVVLVVMR